MRTGPITDKNGNLDLTKGSQLGNDVDFANLDHSTPYIKNPPRIIVTRTPAAFDLLPDGDLLKRTLIELLERQAKSFTGFAINTDIGTYQVPVGRDGQMLTLPTTRTRAAITPSATFDPKMDAVDIKFWKYYLDTLIAHPSTGKPNWAEFVTQPDDWAISKFTFDLLVWEPNATGNGVVWGMACVGGWPQTDIEALLDLNISELRTTAEYNITFPMVYNDSKPVLDRCAAMEQTLRASSINPNLRPATGTEPDAALTALNVGLMAELNEAAKNYLG